MIVVEASLGIILRLIVRIRKVMVRAPTGMEEMFVKIVWSSFLAPFARRKAAAFVYVSTATIVVSHYALSMPLAKKKQKLEQGESSQKGPCTDAVKKVKYLCGHTACSTMKSNEHCANCAREKNVKQAELDLAHDKELMIETLSKHKTEEAQQFVSFYVEGKKIRKKGRKYKITDY